MSGDLKLTITLDGAQAIAVAAQLKTEIDETKKGADRAKSSYANLNTETQRLARNISAKTAALVDATKAFATYAAGITAAGVALARTAAAHDQHERAVRSLGRSYDLVSEATRGTLDAESALRAQQSLTQSGLRVTAEQFAVITRRARDYALATGTETPQALDQLVDALRGGEAEGLRRFGLSADHTGNRVRGLQSAIHQMKDQTNGAVPPLRTASEEMATLGRVAQTTGGIIASSMASGIGTAIAWLANLVGAGNGALTTLGAITSALGMANNETGDAASRASGRASGDARLGAGNRYNRAAAAARARGFTGRIMRQDQFRNTADLNAAAARLEGAGSQGAFTQANAGSAAYENSLALASGATTSAEAAAARREAAEDLRAGNRPGGGGSGLGDLRAELAREQGIARNLGIAEIGGGRETSFDRRGHAHLESQQHFLQRLVDAQKTANEARITSNREANQQLDDDDTETNQATLERQNARTQAERAHLVERQTLLNAQVQAVRTAMEQEAAAQREHMDTRKQMSNAWRETLQLDQTASQGFAHFSTQAFNGVTNAFKQHLSAFITGKESIGEALNNMLKETLLSVATEAAIQSLMEGARAIAAYATPATAAMGPGHTAAAFAYAGVAAATGLGAAAMYQGGNAAPVTTGGGFSASASGPSPGAGGSGGNTIIYEFNVSGGITDREGFAHAVGEGVQMLARTDSLPPELRR